ncbi:MAG: hypothetical protein WC055_00915 [Melioribacteraceae bacterium]
MKVEWIYCQHCGYEDFDVFVAYSRSVANGDVYLCPACNKETMSVETGEE